MRGWITGVMLVTFLSGGMSGFIAGRTSAPEPVERTWVDDQVDMLQSEGVDRPADLENARKIYEQYRERVRELKGQVEHVFRDRLSALAMDAEGKIQEILDTYPELSTGTEEK
jgi:hypothetical protein